LVLITASVFWPGLGGGFLFDDYPNILSNPRVQADELNAESLVRAAGAYQPGTIGRPLATISFAVDYSIAGKQPRQFKLTGLLVHLVNGLLVLLLTSQLLKLRARPDQNLLLASLAISMLWAIHPIQVSTVLYIVQRMETLSLTFVLLALAAYCEGRKRQIAGKTAWGYLLASPLLAAIGLLSKETAALFPAYTLALELALFRFGAAAPATARRLRIGYAIAVVAALALFLFVVLPKYIDPSVYSYRDFTVAERLMTQLRVLPMYAGWILLPLPGSLVFYYDNYPASVSLVSPWTTLAGGLISLASLAVSFRFREKFPYAFLGVLWFFASHLITSNVLPLELVFEHRNYFSILAILLVAYDLIRHLPLRDGPRILRVAVAAIVVGFGALTMIRSATWGDPLLLAVDLAEKNTSSARASSDLGEQYMTLARRTPNSPYYSLAEAEFERGSLLPNASPLPEQALILLAATAGVTPKTEWWDRIDSKLQSQPIGPQEMAAVLGLLKQKYNGIELDSAQLGKILQTLFSRQTMPASAYAQYGDFAKRHLGNNDLATNLFVKAVSAQPQDADYARKLVSVLIADGNDDQARAVVERAIELGLIEEQKAQPGPTKAP
jgi:hypothetical protein